MSGRSIHFQEHESKIIKLVTDCPCSSSTQDSSLLAIGYEKRAAMVLSFDSHKIDLDLRLALCSDVNMKSLLPERYRQDTNSTSFSPLCFTSPKLPEVCFSPVLNMAAPIKFILCKPADLLMMTL